MRVARPDADGEDAGGLRVQRAGVPDPLHSQDAAHLVDHVVRGHPGRLVDVQNPVDFRFGLSSWD